MKYTATISFISLESGERVKRSYRTDSSVEFMNWINKYLKMPIEALKFRFENASVPVYKDFKWPKKLRKLL